MDIATRNRIDQAHERIDGLVMQVNELTVPDVEALIVRIVKLEGEIRALKAREGKRVKADGG